VPEVHEVVGYAVVSLFAVGWIWGLIAWLAKRRPGQRFWIWLAATQVVVGAQAIVGAILYFAGHRASTLLHYAYGIFPVLVLVAAHVIARETTTMKPSPRTGKKLQPSTPFAWGAFVCFGLTLRALTTGLGIG
jgi:heme A synthase